MLTGQIIDARSAKELGLVAELMPREALLPRAWEMARELAKKNDLLLRYTRVALIQPLKKWMEQEVMYHLALESLAKLDKEDVLPTRAKSPKRQAQVAGMSFDVPYSGFRDAELRDVMLTAPRGR